MKCIKEIPLGESHFFFLLPERRVTFEFAGRQAEATVREAGAGRHLLAVSAPWSCGLSFRHTVAGLAEKFRIAVLEPPVAGADSPVTAEQYAEWLGAAAVALGANKSLWLAQGESALASLLLALERPELCAGLVMISPPLELPRRLRLRGRWLARPKRQLSWARRASASPFRQAELLLDYADPAAGSREEIRLLAGRWETLPAARNTARTLAATLSPAYRERIKAVVEERLERPAPFSTPLFVLVGEKDRRSEPGKTRLLARAFPGSQLKPVPDAGSVIQVERPHLVVEAAAELISS